MTRYLFLGAFALGLLAILWIGRLFMGTDLLGFGVTLLIGGVFVIGSWELAVYRRSTGSLLNALQNLQEPVDDLATWLSTIEPSLQNAVRIRVEGQRNPLPGPVATPYLVGLLVMLGLLGTFIGMVDTLKGAVVALEGTSELEAIRAGLAAPIEGLGLAFGTSVAGVAASAMLGLLSTISRRERLQASQHLDTKLVSELAQFSSIHHQKLAFQAIQDQAQALPLVAQQLTDLAGSLGAMGDRIGDRLFENQERFQASVLETHRELSSLVGNSLKESLKQNAELLSSNIQPLAETTLSHMSDVALSTQAKLEMIGESQLSALTDSAQHNSSILRQALDANIVAQSEATQMLTDAVKSSVDTSVVEFRERSQGLISSFEKTSDNWAKQQSDSALQLGVTIREELAELRADEGRRNDIAIDRLSELQEVVTKHLISLGAGLEEPLGRLIETASQTPKAAADVIEKLRGEMTKNLARDNELLTERATLMQQLGALSDTLEASATGQREAVDTLIDRSMTTLDKVGNKFGEKVESETSRLADVAHHFAVSSNEISGLGDAFNAAVELFSESNSQLIENLTRIELSLEKSSSRSDEQLGYYVAQAREIIDHNLLSQKEIIDALRAQRRIQTVVKEAG